MNPRLLKASRFIIEPYKLSPLKTGKNKLIAAIDVIRIILLIYLIYMLLVKFVRILTSFDFGIFSANSEVLIGSLP